MSIYPRPLTSAGHKRIAYKQVTGRSFSTGDKRLIWESSVNFYNWKDIRQWYGENQRMELLVDEENNQIPNNIKGSATIPLAATQTGSQPAGYDFVEWTNQDTEWAETEVEWGAESGSGEATSDIDIGFLYVINNGIHDAVLSQNGEFGAYTLVIPGNGGHACFSGKPPGDNNIPGIKVSDIYVKPKQQNDRKIKLEYLIMDYDATGN